MSLEWLHLQEKLFSTANPCAACQGYPHLSQAICMSWGHLQKGIRAQRQAPIAFTNISSSYLQGIQRQKKRHSHSHNRWMIDSITGVAATVSFSDTKLSQVLSHAIQSNNLCYALLQLFQLQLVSPCHVFGILLKNVTELIPPNLRLSCHSKEPRRHLYVICYRPSISVR